MRRGRDRRLRVETVAAGRQRLLAGRPTSRARESARSRECGPSPAIPLSWRAAALVAAEDRDLAVHEHDVGKRECAARRGWALGAVRRVDSHQQSPPRETAGSQHVAWFILVVLRPGEPDRLLSHARASACRRARRRPPPRSISSRKLTRWIDVASPLPVSDVGRAADREDRSPCRTRSRRRRLPHHLAEPGGDSASPSPSAAVLSASWSRVGLRERLEHLTELLGVMPIPASRTPERDPAPHRRVLPAHLQRDLAAPAELARAGQSRFRRICFNFVTRRP